LRRAHSGGAAQLALSKSGDVRAFRSGKTLVADNMANQQWTHGDDESSLLAWDENGRLWATEEHRLRVWEVPPMREAGAWDNDLSNVLSGKGTLTSLTLARRHAFIGARDGVVHVFDRDSIKANQWIPVGADRVSCSAVSSDESLLAAGMSDGAIAIHRVVDRALLARAKLREAITGIHFLRDDLLLTASKDRTIRVWLLKKDALQEKLVLPCQGSVEHMHVSADGRLVYFLISGERGLRCWRLDQLLRGLADLGLDVGFALSFPPRMPTPEVRLLDGTGIWRDEFDGLNFRLRVRRLVDAKIDGEWKSSPSLFLPPQHNCLRWHGWLKAPEAGAYRLELRARDGARLWIDGKLLIDHWKDGELTLHADATFTDRPSRIRLDYYQGAGGGMCKLRWVRADKAATQRPDPIPPDAFFTERQAAHGKK
jgi:hypothetical protein